jgi:tRNA (guanine-N7-)-methyltransferase
MKKDSVEQINPESHTRQIRSYVRREGRMTLKQKRGLEQYWAIYGLEITNTAYDFASVFEKPAPVWLEIGFGMGGSLVQMAKDNPDVNFIGVEVHRPGVGAVLNAIAESAINNLRIFCDDVNSVLKQSIRDGSLDRVNIYFPDPWPKNGHHKRRLIQPEFINLLKNKLTTSGLLHFATDWQPYAEWINKIMNNNSKFHQIAQGDSQHSHYLASRPETKFEHRGRKLGHAVSDLLFRIK